MKILKWLLYIVLALVALVLIIPLFLPATIEISSEKEISVSPEQVFHNAASYTDRNVWDPWLETEPDAAFTIESRAGYTGSEYTWNGKKIKAGRMVVDSVVFGKYIASLIYFGDAPKPSLVEWILDKTEGGTKVTWKFTSDGAYPLERLMLNLFKGQMLSSFEKGLRNLKAYLEENPPVLSTLGEIEEAIIPPMFTLVSPGKGTLEEMGEQMPELYGNLMEEIRAQGIEMAGAFFSHYLSHNDETGVSEYLAGIQVSERGKDAEGITARKYREMKVIQAIHYGPYLELGISYRKMMEYIRSNQIEVTGEVIEFYLTDPGMDPDVTKWQTLITFPLK
ncbi:GyrI-like domain-containing protein [Bacteroidota bacterium]